MTDAADQTGPTGLEVMQAFADSGGRGAGIGVTFGMRPTEVSRGRIVFEATPTKAFYNPLGTVHGGFAATLLDSCLGCAVHTTLGPGVGYTTVDLNVTYLKAMTDQTGPVRAIGEVIQSGRRIATAQARLVDAEGRLYATGTTTCLILEPRGSRAG
jgi:uncharacterized protein (TIGR00369 family)